MSTGSVVIEGLLKYRDGKKWKCRWGVVRKLSPVADCLQLQLYRENNKARQGQTKASLSLQDFLGSESGFTLDKESHTLAILCKQLVVVLAFDSRETLIEWHVKIGSHLGEEQQYMVDVAHVPAKSRVSMGMARLHVTERSFCLTTGLPPRLMWEWQLANLRRYGVVSGKFCFEGGSSCGKGEGLHVLLHSQPDALSTAFDLASQGKLASSSRLFIRKNSGVCASGTPSKERWTSVSCVSGAFSSESSRPLLHSSESGSTCDGSVDLPSTMTRSHGKENTWSSSHRGGGDEKSSIGSGDLDSAETLSLAISDFPDGSNSNDGLTTPMWNWPGERSMTLSHDSRHLAETLYDRPRNILTKPSGSSNCPLTSNSNWTNTFPRAHRLQLTNCTNGGGSSTVSSTPISSPHRTVATPTTLQPLYASNSNFNSPSKRCLKPSTPTTCSSPCSCQSPAPITNPYANYDVPRFALCPKASKEEEHRVAPHGKLDNCNARQRMSYVSLNGSDYDVPKRIKSQLEDCNWPPSGQLVGAGGGTQTCVCQRVMNWAENLLICHRPIYGNEGCSCKSNTVQLNGQSLVHIVQNCMCAPPATTNASTLHRNQPVSRMMCQQQQQHQNGRQTCLEIEPRSKSSMANYVNLDFCPEEVVSESKGSVEEGIIYTQPDPVLDSNVKGNCPKLKENGLSVREDCLQSNYSKLPDNCSSNNSNCSSSPNVSTITKPVKYNADIGNYLLMQPCCLKEEDDEVSNNSEVEKFEPPLRPFLPLTFPRTPCPPSMTQDMPESEQSAVNRARSNSVVESKARVSLKRRSSSADGHQQVRQELKLAIAATSPRNIAYQSDKCWPSAENIAREIDMTTKSSCLELNARDASTKEEEEEAPSTTSGLECSSRRTNRSNCKSGGNRDSASSSDSGVSTSSPKQSNSNEAESTTNSVKPEAAENEEEEEDIFLEKMMEQQPCGEPSCLWCNQKQIKCEGERSLISTSSSDMSDYMETLSLSSHGSSTGDSQMDLKCSSHGSTANTLRPRSRKEYQQIDRYSRLNDHSPLHFVNSSSCMK